ncbi:hypothetical protein R3P38DRAFT_2838611 [Favolaschia claudopus]|uniref:Uncharacterized protein n=1 Tax=Favolaschia claudopus TaxID=2862362 RepID=A0AAW0E850_9AGAR
MKLTLTSTFLALLSFASLAACSAVPSTGFVSATNCKASDRVLVESHNVTVNGHNIQVSTKACSADALNGRSLAKRQVFNACEGETITFTCVTNQGVGPTAADCKALETALPPFLQQQGNPQSFTVAPQFVQEFTLGTCMWAWFNTNPVGGTTLSYCYVGLEANGQTLDGNCTPQGATGGIAVPSSSTLNPVVLAWAQEVLHS